jgi:hypothetical protein
MPDAGTPGRRGILGRKSNDLDAGTPRRRENTSESKSNVVSTPGRRESVKIGSELVHNSPDTLPQVTHVEIDQKPNRFVGEP